MVEGEDATTDADFDSDYDDSINSADAALFELLGVHELTEATVEESQKMIHSVQDLIDSLPADTIADIVRRNGLEVTDVSDCFCICPEELSVPPALLRRITEEVVWSDTASPTPECSTIERTFETIQVMKRNKSDDNGPATTVIEHRRTLTRLENLNSHAEWNALCNVHIRRIVSVILGTDMSLLKTKLNLKPPGGSGFAPHVDAPSLQVPFQSDDGECPTQFVTVMLAIDDMTVANGCLRVALSAHNDDGYTLVPPTGHNPDADGRAGAIQASNHLEYTDVPCPAGKCVLFGGLVPHRSAANKTAFPRRAVFLTYIPNSSHGGDSMDACWHDRYYARMGQLRRQFQTHEEVPTEIAALSTIPRI